MSYGMAAALQAAIYQRLSSDPGLTALVGEAIYDVVPAGQLPGTYVSLGPEEVRERSDKTARGSDHLFTVSVVTDAAGFQHAKAVAGAVSDALDGGAPAMARGRIVSMHFLRARALRVAAARNRRIDLTFRARVEDE
ncbi:DUF3168 domain-containing protein [Palleronia sp. KMU-117]|uniref:DUF3168 domain-containing protein n=1 Tax=Palleronia sp. KMU-117 TaxID=3434108 RepID=UPI003D714652